MLKMDQQQSFRIIQSPDGQNGSIVISENQMSRNQDDQNIQHVVYSQQMSSNDQQQQPVYYQLQQQQNPQQQQQQVYFVNNNQNEQHQNIQLNRVISNQHNPQQKVKRFMLIMVQQRTKNIFIHKIRLFFSRTKFWCAKIPT
jgi:hypothetical protein